MGIAGGALLGAGAGRKRVYCPYLCEIRDDDTLTIPGGVMLVLGSATMLFAGIPLMAIGGKRVVARAPASSPAPTSGPTPALSPGPTAPTGPTGPEPPPSPSAPSAPPQRSSRGGSPVQLLDARLGAFSSVTFAF